MSGLKPSEQRELEDGDYQNGDEIINKETQEKEFKIEENFSASGNWVSLPQQMTLHLRVCKFILYIIECIFLSQGRHYDSFPDFTPSSDANWS